MKKQLLLLTLCFVLTAKYAQAQTQVTFYTNMGTFIVQMYDKERPITTKHILDLVKKKFYDKVTFHRVIDGFMIQGGDPTGTGSGGSGMTIKDEFTPAISNVQKTMAMANAGPNTGDCQFFINLVNNTGLDPKHPVFGVVISNFAVVQAIGKVKKNSSDKPITPVVMDSVRITTPVTAVEETLDLVSDMLIYPNPATEASSILMEADHAVNMQLSLYNQQGQLIGAIQKELFAGTNQISLTEIHKAALAPGMYFIAVNDGKFISRQKFVVTD